MKFVYHKSKSKHRNGLSNIHQNLDEGDSRDAEFDSGGIFSQCRTPKAAAK